MVNLIDHKTSILNNLQNLVGKFGPRNKKAGIILVMPA